MKALHDVKDAAQLLAVSPWTIRAYIRQGKLRPVRIGRLVRLEEQELQRFVAEGKARDRVAEDQLGAYRGEQ
jgi:excisionase family DNA binding protein